jgi:DNA mismatch repair ATPase MutS
MGTNEEKEGMQSSLLVEMSEMSFILTNVTDRSLVLVDELGRGILC